MAVPNQVANKPSEHFPIRLNSVIVDQPLPYDIYLVVAKKAVLFRKKGDVLTRERIKALSEQGGDRFHVPFDQKDLYLNSIKSSIQNPDTSTDLKSKLLKEAAFIHIHDLFTKQDITEVVVEASQLVTEMVNFITSDLNAAASLLKLSVHDYYTYNHCVDVSVYSIALAKKLYGDDKHQLMLAGLGGLLHDIGKRKIDLSVINKKTGLTPEEWQEIKRHPEYGRDFLQDMTSVPKDCKLIVYQHHENYDGTGYPQKLRGEEISRFSRVVTIADVFDALTTNRSYHTAVAPEKALELMFAMQPGKFDPNLFKMFNKNFKIKSAFQLPKDFDPCHPTNVLPFERKK